MAKKISRLEYKAMLDAGRTFRNASLYEQQDYIVDFGKGDHQPKRETTKADAERRLS